MDFSAYDSSRSRAIMDVIDQVFLRKLVPAVVAWMNVHFGLLGHELEKIETACYTREFDISMMIPKHITDRSSA